jgi:tetratricopeptide (TPR) repeat protein
MRRLEGYRVPARFYGRAAPIGEVGARIAPVFRDRDELPTTSDLGETIRGALRESATLVVICSPTSAKSRWVREEILTFKRMGGSAQVFAFIVEGEPKAEGTDNDCFSPALRLELGADGQLSATPAEHVAADARPEGDGKEDAFVRLTAGLLGVGFDELRQREQQRRLRRLTWIAAASGIGMAITVSLAAIAWQARNDARRRLEQGEDLVGFMLGDLHTQLEKIGRLDVLEAVPEKSMAYFAGLDARDLTDSSLMRQAQALRQVGEIRFAQARFPEAMRAFRTAYDRSVALIARHPRDGEMIFQRGQTEFWIGGVHRKLGETALMTEWFKRYCDTAETLAAIDPANMKWQEELFYGVHNLAVADFDEEKLDAARRGFLAELDVLAKLRRERPADLTLQFQVVQAGSWLGSIAERSGDFPEALARFADQVAGLEAIAKAEPGNARWRQRLADALSLHAATLAVCGQRAVSVQSRERAQSLIDALVAGDPQNRLWARTALYLRLRTAELTSAEGDAAGTLRVLDDTRAKLESMATASAKDLDLASRVGVAWRLTAELRARLGRLDAAAAALRAIEINDRLAAGGWASDQLIGECAYTRIVAGQIAAAQNDSAAAREHWQHALKLVDPRLARTNNWRILMPAARALAALERVDASREIVRRLTQFGYHPITAWPETVRQ